ncbi:member of ShlA/HecA/FhaA exofamily domain protein [Acinetobacter sp. AR_0276]|nr:member of ShlA/HecA/FhaA exofamily domain protein [Acinetobacter sp. AR_0276]
MFIAVAEIVKSKTKQAGQSQGVSGTDSTTVSVLPIHYKKLNPLNFAVIGCLGALVISLPMSSVAETQISADKGAPTSQQPTMSFESFYTILREWSQFLKTEPNETNIVEFEC